MVCCLLLALHNCLFADVSQTVTVGAWSPLIAHLGSTFNTPFHGARSPFEVCLQLLLPPFLPPHRSPALNAYPFSAAVVSWHCTLCCLACFAVFAVLILAIYLQGGI